MSTGGGWPKGHTLLFIDDIPEYGTLDDSITICDVCRIRNVKFFYHRITDGCYDKKIGLCSVCSRSPLIFGQVGDGSKASPSIKNEVKE